MILIIACGNDLREDDGAGLLLAEQLERTWRSRLVDTRRIEVHQLTPELALEIARPEVATVVFVDTRAKPFCLEAGEHQVQEPGRQAAPRMAAPATSRAGKPLRPAVKVDPLSADGASSPSLGHHLGPATLLAYAGGLYRRQSALSAWLVTVPGHAFGYGTHASAASLAAIEEAFNEEGTPLRRLILELALNAA